MFSLMILGGMNPRARRMSTGIRSWFGKTTRTNHTQYTGLYNILKISVLRHFTETRSS